MAVQSIAIGTVFGRLTVIGEAELLVRPNGKKSSRSLVRCECGTEKTLRNATLKNGTTQSCGCSKVKHGKWDSAEWKIWAGIKTRCTNPKYHKYADYGGRGITV